MKGILIDVENEQIKFVEVGKDIDAIYEQINCDCFTVINIENDDVIYVDDEGLFKLNEDSKFFYLEGSHQPIVGNGLILGTDDEGDSVDAKSKLEDIKDRITFLTIQDMQESNSEWLSQFL